MISLKLACVLLFAVCFTLLTASSAAEVKKGEAASDLDASESQSYGYGYGTKVADKYSVSTVYVHGFGTDDYPEPHYNGPQYRAPHLGYGRPQYNKGYGYGHINAYGDAKHGYGYQAGLPHPGVAPYGHGPALGLGYGPAYGPKAPLYHGLNRPHYGGPLVGPHYAAPRLGVASGFNYGFGHGSIH